LIALILEARLSKDEILELYLNDVYLGRSGSIGIYGIGPAARAFFAKEPAELSVAEAATIAGIIHAPNADSPLRHPDRGRTRRDLVLQLMADNGWLAPKELEAARAEPLQVSRRPAQPLEAPFFVDEVLRRLTKMGYEAGLVRGLSVYTSIDLETQHLSERSLAAGLESLERSYARIRRPDDPVEGASILIEAGTGYVRALAGGRDFSRSQFNRVTRSRRQPGSAFKPFVYLAALDDPDEVITPATILRDEPLVLRVGQADWSPTNYDGRFLGEVTVRTAIEGSRNIPTVALAERIGFDRVTALARLAGLGSPPTVPSIALGSEEVSLLDLAGAYTVFPNLGEVLRPALIRGVMTQDGGLLYQDRLKARRVATASAAYVTSHLLEGVVDEGTGAAVRKLGIAQPVAGKTGTTNDEKDAWFIGYSPDWVAGVWVGFDDGTSLGLTGARAALPIWTTLMKDVLVFYEERPFSVPQGVVFRDVDRYSGLLASWSCSDTIREAFVAGTEPTMTCDGRPVQPEDLDEREGGRSSARRRPAPWDGVDHWFRRLFRTR
jgi:penicillin-binding protein 1B